jgi:hypothetical protein
MQRQRRKDFSFKPLPGGAHHGSSNNPLTIARNLNRRGLDPLSAELDRVRSNWRNRSCARRRKLKGSPEWLEKTEEQRNAALKAIEDSENSRLEADEIKVRKAWREQQLELEIQSAKKLEEDNRLRKANREEEEEEEDDDLNLEYYSSEEENIADLDNPSGSGSEEEEEQEEQEEQEAQEEQEGQDEGQGEQGGHGEQGEQEVAEEKRMKEVWKGVVENLGWIDSLERSARAKRRRR